jgi:ribonucleoside-diphosphate reductase alpha chain
LILSLLLPATAVQCFAFTQVKHDHHRQANQSPAGLFRGPPMTARACLPNRRASISFNFEVSGLGYTATFSRFADGRIGELFLSNHKSNSAADTNARDSAIAFSFAVQHGADVETIRRALCRDAQGRASGPLGAALDLIAGEDGR